MKKSAVNVHSTSTLRDGSIPRLSILRMGGMPCRIFISIGTASETCTPTSLTFCQAMSDIPVIWTKRLSGPSPKVPLSPPLPWARRSKVGRIPNGERISRRDLETELAPDQPGLLVARKVDLATHGHRDELVVRGEPLLFDADRVGRMLVARNAACALEIAEGRAAACIDEALDLVVRLPPSPAVRYWNMARQRYSRPSARCCRILRVSADRAACPGPHTGGKPRLVDLGRRIPARDRFATDSPLEGTGFEPLVPLR